MRDVFLRFDIRRVWLASVSMRVLIVMGLVVVGYLVYLSGYDRSTLLTVQPAILTMGAIGAVMYMIGWVARLMIEQQLRIEKLEEELLKLKTKLSKGNQE